MAEYQSPEEVRDAMISTLGDALGAIFYELQNDLIWLHVKWHQYRVLYGSTPERIDLLNDAAPLAFRVVEDALWDDTLLHLCRFTDSAEFRGKGRLSLRQLPPLIEDSTVRTEVESLIQDAVAKTKFARDWRDRRIAHRDLAHSLDKEAQPLEPASRLAVENALAALRQVLNAVNARLKNTEMIFEFSDPIGGADALLRVVRDGVRTRDATEKALRDGTLSIVQWNADHRAI